ncbi:MAG: nitroreductase family protein [Syntrophaceae bacterium]|nr:nitroreductase family protein [Syntrophaceae bacterium]
MNKSIYFSSFLIILHVFSLFGETVSVSDSSTSLKETFDLYVNSVQNSDLAKLFSTVSDSERFYFLTSHGELIDSRQEYHTFHENWFKEADWDMPVELVKIHQDGDFGYTIAIFYYSSKLPDGQTYHLDSYFTLLYHRENGKWKVIADICTPIKRYFSGRNPDIQYDFRQHYLFDILENRRTVRNFKSIPVPREHIMKILEAAHSAPTAGNQQPWKFLVIEDREKLNRLKEEALSWYLDSPSNHKIQDRRGPEPSKNAIEAILENLLSAPVYIAVLVDSGAKYPDYIIYDGTLAAGYLMIAARALGYGTGFYTTFFPEDRMKKFFNIPDQYKLICFTPIGVPVEWPEKTAKKTLEEVIMFDSF